VCLATRTGFVRYARNRHIASIEMEDAMKASRITLTVTLILALTVAGPAMAQLKLTDTETQKLYITVNTVGTAQTLNHKNVFNSTGAVLPKVEPGFQNAFGNLGFIGKFGKKQEIEVVFDLYLSSRNHPSTTYGNEGYMILHGVPENLESLKFLEPILAKVDVKAGHFLVDFGDNAQHRSNNAIVQKNPLVGNFVVDPNIVSIGMQVSSKPGTRIGWLVGVNNGTTTEDWNAGRGFAANGKLIFYPIKPLRASVSYMTANNSDNPTKAAGGSATQMFSGNRSGERYAGVMGGGQAPGNVFPQAGEKFSAGQLDLTYDHSSFPIKLYGHYGRTQDKDINGSAVGTPEETWNYYAGDVVYKFTPALYAAARYSAATTDMLAGRVTDGKVNRIQVGGGFWLTRNMLMKLEYVTQKYKGFRQGDMVNNGIQAWRNPEFNGFAAEVSFAF
jgi:predicted porin